MYGVHKVDRHNIAAPFVLTNGDDISPIPPDVALVDIVVIRYYHGGSVFEKVPECPAKQVPFTQIIQYCVVVIPSAHMIATRVFINLVS
jgi:hypothetical protein